MIIPLEERIAQTEMFVNRLLSLNIAHTQRLLVELVRAWTNGAHNQVYEDIVTEICDSVTRALGITPVEVSLYDRPGEKMSLNFDLDGVSGGQLMGLQGGDGQINIFIRMRDNRKISVGMLLETLIHELTHYLDREFFKDPQAGHLPRFFARQRVLQHAVLDGNKDALRSMLADLEREKRDAIR